MPDLKSKVDKETLVWAINQVGFVDSFTKEPLDVRDAVTYESKGKLYVVTGSNWDKIHDHPALADKTDVIDGRTL